MPKTINDIIPPSRRKAMEQEALRNQTQSEAPERPPVTEYQPRPTMQAETMPPTVQPQTTDDDLPPRLTRPVKSYRPKFPYAIVGGVVGVIVLAVVAMYAFGGAKVSVTPVVTDAPASGEFTATASAGGLPFEVVTVSAVADASVPAEGTREASDSAQGTITVYNGQDKTQQLIKNTRFESASGLIYRIHDSITVPAGSATAPGEMKVTVYADASGEKYNIPASSFTVPGLKGSKTFDLVYARSAEAMAGGFSGVRPSVAQTTKDKQYAALKPTLDTELKEAIGKQVPDDYVLVSGATWTTYEPQPDGIDSAGTVDIREKGTLTAVIFPKSELGKAILSRSLGTYQGEPVTVLDTSKLMLAASLGAAPVTGDQNFSFTLSGNASVLWVVDPSKIAGAVAGKSRDSAKTLLSGFPEVQSATLVLRPFWAGSYPDDPSKITVSVKDPAGE